MIPGLFKAPGLAFLMPHFAGAGGEIEVECCGATIAGRLNNNVQKTADPVTLCVGLFDQGIRIGAFGVARVATEAGVGINECSTGEFFEAAGVD